MKKILSICFLAIGLGFAQESWLPPDPSSGSPSPAAPAPQASPTGSASIFDSVRGHSYNPFGITGAASSVYDLVLTPSDIYGKKFFYVAPTDKLGFTSFDLGGGSALLGLSNRRSLILGYATPAFGAALEYSIQKEWTEVTTDIVANPLLGIPSGTSTTNTRTTKQGDNIALYFSLPLGASTAYANVRWYTYQDSYITEVSGEPTAVVQPGQTAPPNPNGWTKEDYSDIDANVGMIGALGSLNYDASLNVERRGGTLTSSRENFSSMGEKVVTDDSYLAVGLNANVSIQAVKNETSRILVGSNNSVGVRFFDEVDAGADGYAGDNIISLTIAPNILGEVVLTDNWLAFAGASHSMNFDFGDGDRDEKSSATSIEQSSTQAIIGIRYQKTNWAVETQFVNNDPFAAFGGNNILLQFGGFIYF